MSKIFVLSKNNCQQCVATKRKLNELNVDFTEINMEEDTSLQPELDNLTAMAFATDVLDAKQAPVILQRFPEKDLWFTGFDPDALTKLAASI